MVKLHKVYGSLAVYLHVRLEMVGVKLRKSAETWLSDVKFAYTDAFEKSNPSPSELSKLEWALPSTDELKQGA